MARISEQYKIIHLLEPEDHAAGVDGDSFNLGRGRRALIICAFGELTGDAVLSVYSGASAGTKTTQETFRYRLSDSELKTADGDNYAAWATATTLTLTAASYEDFCLLIEIDADELTDNQEWVTLELSNAASELFLSAIAVVEPRNEAHDIPTMIA